MSIPLFPVASADDRIPVARFPEPSLDPRLLWPSTEYRNGIENADHPCFPTRHQILNRHAAHGAGATLKLVVFEAAVMTALVRILVLDPHFDAIGARVLGPALSSSQARDVRLLTGGGDLDRATRERLRRALTQSLNQDQPIPRSVEVRWNANLDKRCFPFLHDRFAIVDEGLWHFGSTVGGGHPGLTAASGPWSTSETRAAEFFEECWDSCNA